LKHLFFLGFPCCAFLRDCWGFRCILQLQLVQNWYEYGLYQLETTA
jgi:hypothetical protein